MSNKRGRILRISFFTSPGVTALRAVVPERAAAGTAVLTDAMAVGRNDRGHHLGAGSPGMLLRRVACTDGAVEIDVSYAPRDLAAVEPVAADLVLVTVKAYDTPGAIDGGASSMESILTP